jgi:hypothetical protein
MLKRPNVFTMWELRPNRDRFEAQVRKGGEDRCWQWTGGCSGEGDPLCYIYESGGRGRKQAKATRLAFFFFGGGRIVEVDEVVSHTCKNPKCVNPKHLEIKTWNRFTKE